jgi:hypothetical protein
MYEPLFLINPAAIAVATLVCFFFGFLWYGPLFGKTWAGLMGIKMDQKPPPGFMVKALSLQLLGLFLTAYVLAHSVQVWRPSVWGHEGADAAGYQYGLMGGFFTWLGFYVPMQLGKVTWENRPWKLFLLNTAHDFLMLQIFCQILSNWR